MLKVETESSTEFVLRSDSPKLERNHTIQSQQVLIPAGQMGVFSGRTARELGFVKFLAADPARSPTRSVCRRKPSRTILRWEALAPVRVPIQGAMTPPWPNRPSG